VKAKSRKQGGPLGDKAVFLSRGEQAYEDLQLAIQSGTLKPGMRLREIELSKWLGSSRTPVREALNRLQTEGLVIQEPRRGLVIAKLDHNMVTELYCVREVLEGTAAALAARHTSSEEVMTLREIIERDNAHPDDPAKLANNNRLFHETLYRYARNRYILKTLNLLRESMALLGPTTFSLPRRSEAALAEHEAVVSAIERHDPGAAEEAARAHIRAAYLARLKLLVTLDAAALDSEITEGPR
jgi:DNA-binding GntR family transcriptional regulator